MRPSNNPGGPIDVGGSHFPDDLCGGADIGIRACAPTEYAAGNGYFNRRCAGRPVRRQ